MAENLPTFLVTYHYVPDMENRRAPYRQDHLDWVKAHAAAGTIRFAGATLEPVDTALLVFRAGDAYQVRQILQDDPYAKANLITGVSVRRIGVVVGA